MAIRRFIEFKDEELMIMQNSISKDEYPALYKEIQEELIIREYKRKQYEKQTKNQPKAYTC